MIEKHRRKGNIKGRWEEAVNQSKAEDALKVEAVKAATYTERDLAGNAGTVEALRQKFSQLHLQQYDIERRHRLLSREVGFEQLLPVSTLGTIISIEAGVGYFIEGSDCAKLPILEKVLKSFPGTELYFQIGVYGQGDEVPPVEVYACVAQRSNGRMLLPFLVDLPPDHADEESSYGYYKFAMYLPSERKVEEGAAEEPELILELEIDLVPRGGWDAFHRRKTVPPPPPPPRRASLLPAPVLVLAPEDISFMLDEHGAGVLGFSLSARGQGKSRHLRVLQGVSPCVLYHENHAHRMIPTAVLHPDTELFSRQCSACFWIESTHASPESTTLVDRGKTLEFVCPECSTFICSECCRKGNGVIGSVQSRHIALNSEVLFQPGVSALMDETEGMLRQVGRFLLDNAIPIRIEGHINTVQSTGRVLPASSSQIKVLESACDGQLLSERRAENVALFLQTMGVAPALLHSVGWGGSRPLSTVREELNYNRSVVDDLLSRVEFHFVFSDCGKPEVLSLTSGYKIELRAEVLFEPGCSTLMNESYNLLDQVARMLRSNAVPVRIEGHINTVQSTGRVLPANSPLIKVLERGCNGLQLSERRAKTVANHLISLGVKASLLHPVGCGGSRPVTRHRKDLDQNRRRK